MGKKDWDSLILYVWIIVLLIWSSVFIYFRFFFEWITFIEPPQLNEEYINEQNEKCRAMRDSLNFLSEDCEWDEIGMLKNIKRDCFSKKILKEIFYSPKLHECVVAYVYHERYTTRSIENQKIIDEYTFDWSMDKCSFYKNWEIIDKYDTPIYWIQCKDDIKFLWEYKLGELKKQ